MLLALYKENTIAEVARRIGRPVGGVNRRIRMLRTNNPSLLAKKRPFSQAEDDFIKRNCKTMTVKQVAAALDRKPGDITQKALRMGLSFFKCGDMHHSTLISDADVQLIRALRNDGPGEHLTFFEIADKFEITPHAAWWACNGRLTSEDTVARELLSK